MPKKLWMQNFNSKLNEQLNYFLLLRGQISCWAFVAFGLFLALDRFGTKEHPILFIFLGGTICLINAVRLIISHYGMKNLEFAKKLIPLFHAFILSNAVLWSLAFSLIAIEKELRSDDILLAFVLKVGLAAASIVTLSYSSYLWIVFQALMTIPIIFIALFFASRGVSVGVPIAISELIFFLYLYGQSKAFREQIIASIVNGLKIEQTNTQLVESRKEIIRQTAKAEHASRLASLGEMAGGIAHEVNNPLAIVLGNVEHIRKLNDKERLTPEKFGERLSKIEEAAHRISKIVKGLRHFSRQSDNDPMVDSSIREIIQDTIDFGNEKFRAAGIEIKVSDGPDFICNCRPIQVSQILINLLNNALDALEKWNGEKWILIKLVDNQNVVRISVINSGPKISREVQDKLFLPFFTTKEIGRGTGLGLSISQGIASEHGGELFLEVTSEFTSFCLTLPIAKDAQIERKTAA